MGLTAHANCPTAAQALSVRPLPQRCNHLQPLRPWSALLQRGLRAPGHLSGVPIYMTSTPDLTAQILRYHHAERLPWRCKGTLRPT